jgi:hypothetical protein
MPPVGRIRVSLKPDVAMKVNRAATVADKLCYVMVTNRPLTYEKGKSRIAYIGTTQRGVIRMTRSVSERSIDLLGSPVYYGQYGVKSFDVRVLTCTPRPGVKTWRKLERALLLEFRKQFGSVPKLNVQGRGYRETDEFTYFRRARIRDLIQELSG